MATAMRIQRAVWTAALYFMLMIAAMCLQTAAAAENDEEQKIVRVGYVNVPTYEEGGEGEYKRGSGYEYLQKISYVTGWKYEYVYATFKECYDMLVSGEIDLFGNVSYKPERAEQIDYSTYPQGRETYLLYTTRQHAELMKGDIHALNHCRIGVTEGSYQEGLLKDWLIQNEIQAEVLYHNGYDRLMAALDAGELDAIVTPDLALSYAYEPIVSIGFSDYYFGVSKSRPDLLKELNAALYEIQNTELDYNNLLVSRYNNRMSNNLLLNAKEEDWLAAHDNILKIGYMNDNLPYSDRDQNGEMRGVMRALVDTLEREFGIDVQTACYETNRQLSAALLQGEVDAVGPVYGDFYLAEQWDIVQTNAFLSSTLVQLFKDPDRAPYSSVIAVSEESLIPEAAVHVLYPEAELYACGGMEESLNAVASGRADSTLVTSVRLNVLRQYRAMGELQFADTAIQADICLMTTKANRVAASILNKGITISSDTLNGVVLAENSYVKKRITLSDFVREYMTAVFIGVGIVLLILGLLIYQLLVNSNRLAAALEAAEKEKEYAYALYLNNSELKVKANQDALTRIGNRHYFLTRMGELLAARETFVLCYCDLDNLKYINDRYGHVEGDRYIHHFVRTVSGHIWAQDVFARIGGDEFCIVFRGCGREDALRKIRQMQKVFGEEWTGEYPGSFSCGAVEVPENHDGMDTAELLNRADALMYVQKKEHKEKAGRRMEER